MTPGVAPVLSDRSRDEEHMRHALAAAQRAALAGEAPIGACLVRDGTVIATAANAVIAELDVTAHAELRVIREACRRERRFDLAGCVLYTTVEPCGMCRVACHYAGVGAIVCAATLADFHALTGNELAGAAEGPALTAGCLREESLELLNQWVAGGRG
jgi:tRNA(Arg) A34 adenosine deaminase TadA